MSQGKSELAERDPSSPVSVSLVIPNWNGEDLLRIYLPSVVVATEAYPGEAEIIVVDDGSTDDSVGLLRRSFPSVRLVRHKRNRGFGRACMTGARAARHPIVVLLNSDMCVEPHFLAPLMIPFDDRSTFAASPLILDESGRMSGVTLSIPYLRRGKIRYRSFPAATLVTDGAAAPGPWYTLFPSGGACALDRRRFLDLGGFDDLFHPFYYEDTDLGFRAWRRGWTCRVVPASRVTHCHTATIARYFN
ncbi:glycosyltransferase family 2 protein, partial [Planctomycetota bacterium]